MDEAVGARRRGGRVLAGTTKGSGTKEAVWGGVRMIAGGEGGGGWSWSHLATSVTVECSTAPVGDT